MGNNLNADSMQTIIKFQNADFQQGNLEQHYF